MSIIKGGQGRTEHELHDSAWGIAMVIFMCASLALLLSMFCCGCCADLRDIGGSGADNRKPPSHKADAATAEHYSKAKE
jgi:hypothetical protein